MTSPESEFHARWWPSAHGFPPGEDELYVKQHVLLFGFAGRFADEEVADFRVGLIRWPESLLTGIVLTAIESEVPLTRPEVNLIVELSRAFWPKRGDPPHIDQVPLTDELTDGGHRFVARPEVGRDYADHAIASHLSLQEGALRVWRAWRDDPGGPRRLFLAEYGPGAEAWMITHFAAKRLAELKAGVRAHGADAVPTVEVFWRGQDLPPYHRAALTQAELLWARDAQEPGP